MSNEPPLGKSNEADVTYVIRATAQSIGATGYPIREEHAALVFVHTNFDDAAESLAIEHLEASGWSCVELHETGLLNVDQLDGKPAVIDVYERCLAVGSAGIIFKDPLND